MRTAGAVRIAGGIHQSAAEGFCRNQSLEAKPFRSDHALLTPGLTSIQLAVEGDRAVAEVAPGDIDLAVGADEGNRTNAPSGSAGIIRASNAERCPMIRGGSNPNSAAGRAARCCIPRQ